MTQNKDHLPLAQGPHSVGFVDYEDQKVRSRIYYPTQEDCQENIGKWPLWGQDDYILGLVAFMKAMTARWPSWAPRGEFEHFDSIRHLAQWIPQMGVRSVPYIMRFLNGRVHVPIIAKAKLNQSQKWPLVVFSHGLGCAPFTYSQICYDLASNGFIVIAPEHRDGSACLSYHIDAAGKKWPIPHRRVEWSEEEYFVRSRQVRERSFEACQTLNLAFDLNSGSSSIAKIDSETDQILGMFKDGLDLSNPVMCGHSFGGATTLMALGADDRFKVGIVLDGWLFPIRDENNLTDKVKQRPILFVNTESFLNQENLKKMETFKHNSEAERLCYYIKGSVHQNQLDAPDVFKSQKLKRMLGMHSETCHKLVMTLNNKLILQFLYKHLNLQNDTDLDIFIENNKDLIPEGFGTDHLQVKTPGLP